MVSLDFSPLRPISGVSQLPVFLTFFFVPSQQPGMLLVSEQTFQPWYYRSIPHNLSRNPLPRGLVISLSITRVILSDLVPTRSAYRAFIHTLVLTAVQDAVINACKYLLHI